MPGKAEPKRANAKDKQVSRTRTGRLSPEDRRNQILTGAITFFAERGFEGGTRALAKELGITQPLLYNYFPTKEDLIREVYENVFVDRWRAEWTDLLTDRGRPINDRLFEFYMHYTDVIYSSDWLRIYLHAGLKNNAINSRWIAFIEGHLLPLVCEEVRHANNLPTLREAEITRSEADGFWLFHGGIFYYGVRGELFKTPVHLTREKFVRTSVDSLLIALPKIIEDALKAECAKPAGPS